MRILRLTNSNDVNDEVPAELRSTTVAERIVAARLREPVETTVRIVWPDPELPQIVESWLNRYEPDVVFMRASSYWYTYESVPLRLQRWRKFGLPALGRVGANAATKPRLANNAPFRFARRMAVRTIGGDTYFTPEGAAATVEAVIRRVVARESVLMVVRGPLNPHNAAGNAAGLARSLARNERFNRLVSDSCRDLHVPFVPVMHLADPQLQLADEVHEAAEGHRIIGEVEGEAIASAVIAARSLL